MATPDPLQKLITFFTRLPSIGPRQASRFASHLLDEDTSTIRGFADALTELANSVGRCAECARSIDIKDGNTLCENCRGGVHGIFVVEKDQDLDAVLKSGLWQNGYHVLGGTISLLNEKTRVTDRIKLLYDRLAKRTADGVVEVVLATSATPEGDATALYIEKILEPYTKKEQITLTRLGRGISTGTEMEFADPETLKNAIINRK